MIARKTLILITRLFFTGKLQKIKIVFTVGRNVSQAKVLFQGCPALRSAGIRFFSASKKQQGIVLFELFYFLFIYIDVF